MKTRRTLTALLAVVSVVIAGCAATSGPGGGAGITVYSAAGLGAWYSKQFEKFTEQTGVKVTLFEAGSGELISRVNSGAVWERLDATQENVKPVPPADLVVVLPPFIQKAAKSGILQPSGVDAGGISGGAVDPGGLYVPIVNTALCFIANPALNPQPQRWDDLLRPELKGKLQYSTPGESGDGTAVLLLLQHLMGKQGALDYLARLAPNNVGPSPSTGALQPKVSSGELLVANGDVQMNLASINNDGANFRIFFPAMADGTRTTVSLPYVAGVTAASQRPDDAKKLLALLLTDDAQRSVVSDASGIPVRDSIARDSTTGATAMTPTTVLDGVAIWSPDWNTVLAELDTDIAAYKKVTGG